MTCDRHETGKWRCQDADRDEYRCDHLLAHDQSFVEALLHVNRQESGQVILEEPRAEDGEAI